MNAQPLFVDSTSAIGSHTDLANGQLHFEPFENTRDRSFYFPSAAHEEALSGLMYLAEDGNYSIGVLSGTVGCGKTLLRTILHARLDRDRFIHVNIENSLLDFDGLLLEIISQICGKRHFSAGLPDRYSRLARFKYLLSNDAAGRDRHLVITIDEAQMLERVALESIRALTNITAERKNLMTVILVGQPELEATISSLPQLGQRIGLRYRIDNLGLEEMFRYIEHRLSVAGWRGSLPFARKVLDDLHRVSHGNPRILNRLLKLALEHARKSRLPLGDYALAAVISDKLTGSHQTDQI